MIQPSAKKTQKDHGTREAISKPPAIKATASSNSSNSILDDLQTLKPSHIPTTGFLRLPQIIGNPRANPPVPPIIPVGKSTWWAGVKSGRYPQPVRTLGERITAWRAEDIHAYICNVTEAGHHHE